MKAKERMEWNAPGVPSKGGSTSPAPAPGEGGLSPPPPLLLASPSVSNRGKE